MGLMNLKNYNMKNFHKAIKDYRFYKNKKGYNAHLLYNFLSNRYWVTLYYTEEFLTFKFKRTHEIIL